ncbi:gamma carbonic anhydrase family protein [Clostridium tepidum]|jgi:carbonic anhydrase/acetyltransferase-like protein (isoleucine patch superfamily)|uniref:Gamma carbonic anhydrase family protein n=1 Tax=Clostridium tepidum TaxID=1962263 RepID=A0A1S9I1G6_9CLOT|nr:gamma carbonic anhydrase family protein [Clostridium tepidum]MCR1934608.1 gamma carbonic anhydrase family protein [Clostridium tepidum]MDU6877642.1 gamma carbonic anhydrase family protein [Clostridium botulinum]OOO62515.1 gamma carbonic anhydrase family protein [Clostridium tepidum]OOO64119.1 gamma carbonic anhydrase family protein [Clostridium tepidum]
MIYEYNGKKPVIKENVFLAKSAELIGDVVLEENCTVLFGAVLRGDINSIYVGSGSNIQDNCVIHVDEGDLNVHIGNNVTVGHGAILHGCKINDNSLIGMGSIILNGAEIGSNTIIGAGSLVTSNKKIPSGVLCMGSPARIIRELSEKEIESIKESAQDYMDLNKNFRRE